MNVSPITSFHLTKDDYEAHIKKLEEEAKIHPEDAYFIEKVIHRDRLLERLLDNPNDKAAADELKAVTKDIGQIRKDKSHHSNWKYLIAGFKV